MIIRFIFFLLVLAGVLFFLERTGSESDDAIKILTKLQSETDIEFSDVARTQIDWNIEINQQIKKEGLRAFGVNVKNGLIKQYRQIEGFFQKEGFELDVPNLTETLNGQIKGFVKGETVCLVTSEFNNELVDLQIDCADLNSN